MQTERSRILAFKITEKHLKFVGKNSWLKGHGAVLLASHSSASGHGRRAWKHRRQNSARPRVQLAQCFDAVRHEFRRGMVHRNYCFTRVAVHLLDGRILRVRGEQSRLSGTLDETSCALSCVGNGHARISSGLWSLTVAPQWLPH